MSKLTDTQIRQAKPKEKDYILSDGGGLRLMVKKNGVKTWLFNYYTPYTKKKNNITIGQYPLVTLAQARAKRTEFKALLAQNIDPVQQREQARQEQADGLERTFERLAWQWFESRRQQANFSERTAILPNGEIIGEPDKPVMFRSQSASFAGYDTQGTLESWQNEIARYVNRNPSMMLGVAVALSAPLTQRNRLVIFFQIKEC